MPIVGGRPETGVRIEIERGKSPETGAGPPWAYTGAAYLPDASVAVSVLIDAAGEVTVTLGAEGPADLASRVRLIVRTVFRQAQADGEPPPRRIVRWRGVK